MKVFISHCGWISSLESVYFGVPVICLPVMADQPMNAALLKQYGMSVTIHPEQLNENTLKAALDDILGNDKYVYL